MGGGGGGGGGGGVQLRVAIEEDREKLNKKEALFKIIGQKLLKKLNLFRSWMLTVRGKLPLNTMYN